MIFVKLVRFNVRPLRCDLVRELIFFSYDGGAGVELLEVVDHGILNVDISLSKDIIV
jgi:hypothetical protein